MKFATVDDMLYGAYSDVLRAGASVDPRGAATLELPNWSCTLMNPRRRLLQNTVRDIRKGYAAAKLAWDVCGLSDIETLQFFNPNASWYNVYGRAVGENYGERFKPYLDEAMELIRLDRSTRRAWVPVWMPKDMIEFDPIQGPMRSSRSGVSTPCCIGFHLLVREERLHMQVLMRSQSIGVMPYDVFLLSGIQELVANSLGLKLGQLYWHADSLHVYESELEQRKSDLAWWRRRVNNHLTTMYSLPHTLDDARERWYPVLQRVLTGPEACAALRAERSLDEIEIMIVDDAERAYTEAGNVV